MERMRREAPGRGEMQPDQAIGVRREGEGENRCYFLKLSPADGAQSPLQVLELSESASGA